MKTIAIAVTNTWELLDTSALSAHMVIKVEADTELSYTLAGTESVLLPAGKSISLINANLTPLYIRGTATKKVYIYSNAKMIV